MTELIKMLKDEGLIIPIQLILLAIDGYLLVTNRLSGFAFISFILIASTFVLQAVRGRFLLLYPRNSWAGRETAEIDTYYLRFLILTSTFSTVLALSIGLVPGLQSWKWDCDRSLPWLAFVFIAVIPFIFCISSSKINNRIADKLKRSGPCTFLRQCPFCDKGFALETHEVIDCKHGSVNLRCYECGKDETRQISLNIGEV